MRALFVLAWLASAPVVAEPSPVGRWLTQDGGGIVGIHPCGDVLCGSVDGIITFQPNGAPPVDYRGQSRCHLTIISDLEEDDPGVWAGHITNPDDGKTYTIQVTIDPTDHLRMRGYFGIPLLGRTTVWSRYRGKLSPDCHAERD